MRYVVLQTCSPFRDPDLVACDRRIEGAYKSAGNCEECEDTTECVVPLLVLSC
jgi:hypothetical protein